MIEDPLGRFTTWWGVSTGVDHHGRSGIGTSKIPNIHSDVAAFGTGDISMDGRVIATGVPVHIMTAESGIPGKFEMDVGDPDMGAIPGLPDGHLRVLWDSYQGDIPKPDVVRESIGFVILVLLLIGALWLNRTEK